ncbi:hypothetical protein DNI29_23135 [Hymenobacter sediminis]|uniref:hypothetical protein n=1 Tax=Hymenobacter sediminis TaxID=2218621 RepID=UPI000F4EA7A6|nr:hypothetical protein [Hymenobacter sediminis]RPD43757.1 hypothetical protein DNI29_23135 [Hymenobacter sediminis]
MSTVLESQVRFKPMDLPAADEFTLHIGSGGHGQFHLHPQCAYGQEGVRLSGRDTRKIDSGSKGQGLRVTAAR